MQRRICLRSAIVHCLILFQLIVVAQSTAGITGRADTSFTLNSEYLKIKKNYPFIALATERPSPDVTTKKSVSYCTVGNRKLLLDAFYPSKKAKEKRAAIVIIHGGGWRSGNRSQHHSLAQRLAAMGYVCFTPEYRLSTEALYPAAVQDLRGAIRWVHSHAQEYHIDTAKIVVAGFSAGGQLAALLGTTFHTNAIESGACNPGYSASVKAIVDMDGILSFIHPESGEGKDSKKTSAATHWFGYAKEENPALWKQASALTHVSNHTPPTLFINSSVARMHAGRDDFIKVLDHFNIYNEVKSFEGAPHSFPLFHPWFDSTVRIIDGFLKKVFEKKKARSKTMIVAQDGSGEFRSVQAAFDAVPVNNQQPVLIFIKNGTYHEKLFLDSTKRLVTVVGEDKFKTILTYNDHTGKISPKGDTINTYTSHSFLAAADDFTAKNITFQNDAGFSAGQAVAIRITGDRARFFNCRFVGNQDVLFPSKVATRQYFADCYIEGTTDFIFGPSTAWFERCHIHSKKNSHITAASTPRENKFGYVFNDCVLTGDTTLQNVSLGRPWRPYAHVVYMNTYIGKHIKPEGWANWNNTDNYLTARYEEYNNYGPSANAVNRVKWAKQLTEEEAKKYTLKNVFAGWDPRNDDK